MRKITLSIVTCMVFVFANAQSTRFGVKGGLNISNFTGYQEDVKSLAGFHIRGFADVPDNYDDYPDFYNASFKNSNFALSLAYKF